MEIILDNIIYSLQKAGGISVYWTELLKRIPVSYIKRIIEYKNNNIHSVEIGLKSKKKSNKLLIFRRYFPIILINPEKTIFHSSYYRLAVGKKVRNIVTIHDFTFEKYLTNRKGASVHIKQKKRCIMRADGIICVSNSTKDDLLNSYPSINPDKVKVIYNGVSEIFRIPRTEVPKQLDFVKNDKYVLFVGSRISYKKFDVAVEAIHRYANKNLYIVGSNFSNDEKKMLDDKIKGRYRLFENINNVELKVLYENAYCLIYPSSYEGFGIPIAEAMSTGCPVIAVNNSSIPEVCGDAGLLVNHSDPDLILEKLTWLEAKENNELIKLKGKKQAEKFSWNKMAKETIEFYKEVYEKI